MALPPFRAFVRLESVDPARNRAWFWMVHLQPSLWEGLVLVRT